MSYPVESKEDYYKLPVSVRMIYIISSLIKNNDQEFKDLINKNDDLLAEKYPEWFSTANPTSSTETLRLVKEKQNE